MKAIKFTVENGTHGSTSDEAFAMPGEDTADTIVRSVVEAFALDIQVTTAGNVTATLGRTRSTGPATGPRPWSTRASRRSMSTSQACKTAPRGRPATAVAGRSVSPAELPASSARLAASRPATTASRTRMPPLPLRPCCDLPQSGGDRGQVLWSLPELCHCQRLRSHARGPCEAELPLARPTRSEQADVAKAGERECAKCGRVFRGRPNLLCGKCFAVHAQPAVTCSPAMTASVTSARPVTGHVRSAARYSMASSAHVPVPRR